MVDKHSCLRVRQLPAVLLERSRSESVACLVHGCQRECLENGSTTGATHLVPAPRCGRCIGEPATVGFVVSEAVLLHMAASMSRCGACCCLLLFLAGAVSATRCAALDEWKKPEFWRVEVHGSRPCAHACAAWRGRWRGEAVGAPVCPLTSLHTHQSCLNAPHAAFAAASLTALHTRARRRARTGNCGAMKQVSRTP